MTDDTAAFADRRILEVPDLDAVLELNQRWVPHVGALEADSLAGLVERSTLSVGAFGPEGLRGFVIAMAAGADYPSPNYRWFAERHRAFTYVDRIAVADHAQGEGLGRALYAQVIEHGRHSGSPVLCAEVNLDPPNPDSQQFHACMGFVEVGRQWTYGHTVEVQLLELAL